MCFGKQAAGNRGKRLPGRKISSKRGIREFRSLETERSIFHEEYEADICKQVSITIVYMLRLLMERGFDLLPWLKPDPTLVTQTERLLV